MQSEEFAKKELSEQGDWTREALSRRTNGILWWVLRQLFPLKAHGQLFFHHCPPWDIEGDHRLKKYTLVICSCVLPFFSPFSDLVARVHIITTYSAKWEDVDTADLVEFIAIVVWLLELTGLRKVDWRTPHWLFYTFHLPIASGENIFLIAMPEDKAHFNASS